MKSIRHLPLVALLSLSVVLVPTAPARAAADDALYAALWQAAWIQYRFWEVAVDPLPISGRRRVTRVISIDIDAPRDHVYDVYSDVNNHIGRHAFLQRVITHRDRVVDGVHVVDFTAIENVPIAGIPVPTPTYAHQELYDDAYFYDTDTWTSPDVETHQRVTFTDLGGGRTRITENLMFETNVLLIDFTVTNGVAAHQQNLAAFKVAFESGGI